MNPNTIRKIDYRLGIPVCCFLTLCRKIFSSFSFSANDRTSAKRIVFLKFIEQGATVLAYGAIKRAIEIAGRENVYFCVFSNNRPILDILNLIPPENIIEILEKTFLSFITSAITAIRKIRKYNINVVIDMEFFSRASTIFAYLCGAKIRVGLHRFTSELPYRGNLFTHRIQYNPYLHTAAFYYLLAEAILQDPAEVPMLKIPLTGVLWTNQKLSLPVPVFAPSEAEKNAILSKINDAFSHTGSVSKEPAGKEALILLNPNASDMLPLRKWEQEKFTELAKKIISEIENARIIITGAPSEQKDAEEICRKISSPKVVSLAGKTSLRELLTLYSVADILVTNDSGPGHFASLTKVKTIILFGPETPKLFGPVSSNAHIIWKELACSPCVSVFNHRFSPCNNNVCMKSITVDEVYSAIKKYF